MADRKFMVHLDLNQNEIKNGVIQRLSTPPANPKEGQFYWNTVTKLMYTFDGEKWVDVGSTYVLPEATADTLGGVKIGTNIDVATDGTISVKDASTSDKGIIQIATDAEITAGTATTKAVTPKQVADIKSDLADDIKDIQDTIDTYGDIVTHDVDEFATAAQGALADTAIQPGDNVSELTNDANYIDLTALSGEDNISYDNTTGKIGVAAGYQITSTSEVTQIETNKQDIATINTTLDGFGDIVTHNSSEYATAAQGALADSAVQPGDNVSDLTNDANYIDLTALSATDNLTYDEETGEFGVASTHAIPTTTQVGLIDTALQPSDVVDNTSSTATDAPLSANMGKELQDQIDNLKAIGRFLSLWDCTSGLPETNPTVSPYVYHTGDYFIVSKTGDTNYRPAGTQYVTDVPSTTVETATVAANDMYYYDGTEWKLLVNTGRTVTFANIAGQPEDNTNLAAALNAKVDANSAIVGNTHTKITYDSKGLVTGGTDLVLADIPDLTSLYMEADTTIDDLLPSQTGKENLFLTTDGTNASWGKAPINRITATNPALTPAGGVATWTITNSLGNADVVCTIKDVESGEEVYANVTYSASSVIIKMNSDAAIAEGTFKATIIG